MEDMGPVVTSEAIGKLMKANPVVVRRTMGGLRAAGILRSEKGHGGGWSLARKLEDVSLADVYAALGTRTPFSIGPRTESPGCLVEQAVNGALGKVLGEAEALLLKQLRGLSVADLAKTVHRSHARAMKKGAAAHD